MENTTLMTFKKVCEEYGMSKDHLYHLNHKNAIPYFKPSGKVIYYEKSDVEKYIRQNRVKSITEINQEAANYVTLGKL